MKQKLWICGVGLLLLTGCVSAKPATHEHGAPAGTSAGTASPAPSGGGTASPAPSGGGRANPDDYYGGDKGTKPSDGTQTSGGTQGSGGAPTTGSGQGSEGAQGGASTPDLQRMTVVLKDFAFEPNVITLKKGIPVEITLLNQGTRRHDFSIVGDFSFESDVVPNGEKLVVHFTPDKVGTFQLVCSQIGHKASGMVAQVIVTG